MEIHSEDIIVETVFTPRECTEEGKRTDKTGRGEEKKGKKRKGDEPAIFSMKSRAQ